MAKMKATKIEYPLKRSWGSGEEELDLDGNVVPRVVFGNFIKMMVLYDDEVDDATLDYFGTNFSLLYRLLREVNWSNCFLRPNGVTKNLLCKKLKIGSGAYEKHLREYVRLGLLVRLGVGDYMVNPMKLFVGEAEEQRQRILEFAKMKGEAK